MKVHIKSKYVDEEVGLARPFVRINHQLSVIRKEC